MGVLEPVVLARINSINPRREWRRSLTPRATIGLRTLRRGFGEMLASLVAMLAVTLCEGPLLFGLDRPRVQGLTRGFIPGSLAGIGCRAVALRMNILSLSTCRLDPLLGSGKTRLRWSEGLRKLGHTVDMAEPQDYETWHGMRRALRFRQAWGACSFVTQKLEAGGYSAIEFFGAEFGLITLRLSKLKERPLIVAHTDGLELLASERERAYAPPRSLMAHAHSWYWRQTHERLSRAAFVYADAFVTGCDLDRQYVVERGIFEPQRTAVIEPGLDDEYLAIPFIAKKEHRVAYTGSWIARKGIEKLIAVMIEVLMRDPELRFDVYSGGDREAVLACFPASLHGRIEVFDRLNSEQLSGAMARAKVFFFPSQYEGFGMSLGEAMACSCAVVTTPTGFGAELRDGVEALVCGFDDVEAMKRSVERLLSDEDLRLTIARNGWERVRALKWDTQIKRLEATYERWCSEWQAHREHGVAVASR